MVQQITAHRAFSELCPVFHFTCFTANQAILETLDRSRSIHLIDFDVGLGAQWSSFLHEIAAAPPPSIRITAIVREEYSATKLSAENLRDFAKNLGLEFTIEFVRAGSLGELRLLPGDSVAVSLTPSSFRLFGNTKDTARQLLRFISNVSPRVTVFADTESSSHSSFRRCFVTGLENSSALLESLDSAAASVAIEDEQMRRIEQFVVKPRIFESLYTSWSFFRGSVLERSIPGCINEADTLQQLCGVASGVADRKLSVPRVPGGAAGLVDGARLARKESCMRVDVSQREGGKEEDWADELVAADGEDLPWLPHRSTLSRLPTWTLCIVHFSSGTLFWKK